LPIYEYKCTHCGHRYELKESFDAPSQRECSEYSGLARRLLYAPAIVFKGSGFYTTDNRKDRPWDSDHHNGDKVKEEAAPSTAGPSTHDHDHDS